MLTHENAVLCFVTSPPATQPFLSASCNTFGLKVKSSDVKLTDFSGWGYKLCTERCIDIKAVMSESQITILRKILIDILLRLLSLVSTVKYSVRTVPSCY
jgi:hypothetical protein